ncbi:hypothetical protein GCM10009602_58860 [Nocardiopsis tropica]
MEPKVSRERMNTGWHASWGLQWGTTTVDTPYPAISHSSAIAKLSARPWANLLVELKVSGQASTASASGRDLP